ncbi:uncharacterized protein LOC113296316 [Papaver somniferum]|uniref:uncharacterized protein LOC113296316 n=1 Tax=Papaver somniferum TaxID=3469 RepID=UPI000E700FEE|nr:uncharacterized protein LOC113296316 [Papaver somniferum]
MIISDRDPHNTDALSDLVQDQNEYNSRETQYSTMMRQKSRIKWVKEGSTNTQFFHTNIKVRYSKNLFVELEDENGNLVSDQEQIADLLLKFFERKFQYQEATIDESLLVVITKIITDVDQQMLEALPTAKEIHQAIFDIDEESAPGPDGFSGRMGTLISKLISPQQVAYIKGRSIHEKILMVSELVNEMKTKRRGGNWLQILFESARISVMVNGGPRGFFSMGRGLKQGDPLSPILFILME